MRMNTDSWDRRTDGRMTIWKQDIHRICTVRSGSDADGCSDFDLRARLNYGRRRHVPSTLSWRSDWVSCRGPTS